MFGQAAAAPGVVGVDVEGEHRRPGRDGEGDDLALEHGQRVLEGEDRGGAEVGVEHLERALADQGVLGRLRAFDRAQDADPRLRGRAEEFVEEADLVGGGRRFDRRGLGEGDRPGDDLAFEGRLVGSGDAAGDRLEAGHVTLDPAGRDLDVVDDFAGTGGRRGFRGLAEHDDPQRRRVGGAGGERRATRPPNRQAAPATSAQARPVRLVFSVDGMNLGKHGVGTPVAPGFCLPGRGNARGGAALARSRPFGAL